MKHKKRQYGVKREAELETVLHHLPYLAACTSRTCLLFPFCILWGAIYLSRALWAGSRRAGTPAPHREPARPIRPTCHPTPPLLLTMGMCKGSGDSDTSKGPEMCRYILIRRRPP